MNTDRPFVPRHFEDLALGQRWTSAPTTLSEDEITQFGRLFDPQPMHVDAAAALDGPFGGLAASGWHLAALVMRLSVTGRAFGDTPVVGAGVDELRWLQPVRPGDTLTLTREIVALTPPRRAGGRGTVHSRMTLTNQRGEPVTTLVTISKMPTRAAGATHAS